MHKITNILMAGFLLISRLLQGQNVSTEKVRSVDADADFLKNFINPPKGYGEVPFYWWQGDSLTRERISWQLDQLSGKGISSLQINYSHRDSGGLTYGLSNPSKPPLFSPEWWNLFRWFADEAAKHEMTVSLSDYTIGVGQGFAMDEAINDIPSLNGSILNKSLFYVTGESSIDLPSGILTLTGYMIKPDSTVLPLTKTDLLHEIRGGKLIHKFTNDKWVVIAIYPEKIIPSFDPMNPESGKAYNKYFFSRFEDALPGKGAGMLNFFFSDELNFRLSGNLWDSLFAMEFRKRKGYDIIPRLDALFLKGDPEAPKIRLDYNDVIVSLSEENFFAPVYQWHQQRGLTFGCDHGGRGRDVTEFGDYFRTQKWNQGPGSDQPRLSKDIIKAKVASSIAHLYNRPRVWLEGFHSSGWGTSSADVTDAIFADFTAGYNLLSFHGLYYSTMGGWWEWAPPDNHWRMPYWNQIDPLMNAVRRLSYLLSHGYHNCDLAIIYPTEPVVTEMEGDKSVNLAFETGEELYSKGIDFDFIDYESIARSEIKNGELTVSGEKYKVIVVPSMKAIRYSTLEKIEAFENGGGLVVNLGDIPEANDKTGINDPAAAKKVTKIFKESKRVIQCNIPSDVPDLISGRYEPGFRILSPISERPYTMHRILGNRDLFFLYNYPNGSKCFFATKGAAELWDPWNGKVYSLSEFAEQKDKGTEISLPLQKKDIQIIVFDHKPAPPAVKLQRKRVIREVDLGNKWEFGLKPSMDNSWGDFELPASHELLGASVSQLYLTVDKDYSGEKLVPDKDWQRITCGFGPQFIKLGPLPDMPSEDEINKIARAIPGSGINISGKDYVTEEYSFSWQKGVEGDYGHQGYHGLKGEMYDNFIRLGAMEDVRMSLKRVPEPGGNFYLLSSSVIAPEDGIYDLLSGEISPVLLMINGSTTDLQTSRIYLKKGQNPILAIYNRACETYLIFRNNKVRVPLKQPVTMRWYKDIGVLPFAYKEVKEKSGLYLFESPPGLSSLSFSAYGKVKVWIGGKEAKMDTISNYGNGLTSYSVSGSSFNAEPVQVVIRIEYTPGYYGGAALPGRITEECREGEIVLGDWSEIDGLRSYSGGAWYEKNFTVEKNDLNSVLEIDLGKVVCSAELFINGKSAGIRPAPPYRFNISGMVQAGENKIEIVVYNTLSNHYTAIPTRYRGDIKSGLLGPVKLVISEASGK